MASTSFCLLLSFFFVFVSTTLAAVTLPFSNKPLLGAKKPSLQYGFYASTCPNAERIVESVVRKAFSTNPEITAGLIRMHFHDCFVRGCDGSVLLKSPTNQAERDHPANNPSLRGFEVIEEAKKILERECPKTVSCADILTFAARDSSNIAGRIFYHVPSGRRDGRVSLIGEVSQNLPPPSFNADQLIANFARKGMSADEMVTLSGAHSFGRSHCSSFSNRLYSFNSTVSQDPSLDRAYAADLKKACPAGARAPTVAMERVTPRTLDNVYYSELKSQRGLLTSDQVLLTSPKTSGMVLTNARDGSGWAQKFRLAMIHMGSLDLLTGTDGEIRRVCGAVNRG